MRRFLIVATVVALALAMGMGVGPAVAQSNETAANQSSGEQVAEADGDRVRIIDNETRVVDWSYEPGRFSLEIEADEPTTISITESGAFEEGAKSFNYGERELDEGTQTVTFMVSPRQGEKGAAVAIATQKSLDAGGGAIVSTGTVQANPFRHFGGETGLFSGVLISVGCAALGAWYVVRSEESGVVEA
ncbi:hypothetical protein CP556_06575 [Natrinema sp. CBA1119]|uniref:hypothetical protein n=1 Tax=Natrinema sp. CBA1119 TaxID=1608465 RepID=UPI000BF3C44F|nr:hypothetical protein [Natrinema sp. CBA1119]PGF15811.1 hypothetical protein CP556_06575 [Natrinema sp. CBA1119]